MNLLRLDDAEDYYNPFNYRRSSESTN